MDKQLAARQAMDEALKVAADDSGLPAFVASVPPGRKAPTAAARRHLYGLLEAATSKSAKKAKATSASSTVAPSTTVVVCGRQSLRHTCLVWATITRTRTAVGILFALYFWSSLLCAGGGSVRLTLLSLFVND